MSPFASDFTSSILALFFACCIYFAVFIIFLVVFLQDYLFLYCTICSTCFSLIDCHCVEGGGMWRSLHVANILPGLSHVWRSFKLTCMIMRLRCYSHLSRPRMIVIFKYTLCLISCTIIPALQFHVIVCMISLITACTAFYWLTSLLSCYSRPVSRDAYFKFCCSWLAEGPFCALRI